MINKMKLRCWKVIYSFFNIAQTFKLALFSLATIVFLFSAFYLKLESLIGILTTFACFMIFLDLKKQNQKVKDKIKKLKKIMKKSSQSLNI